MKFSHFFVLAIPLFSLTLTPSHHRIPSLFFLRLQGFGRTAKLPNCFVCIFYSVKQNSIFLYPVCVCVFCKTRNGNSLQNTSSCLWFTWTAQLELKSPNSTLNLVEVMSKMATKIVHLEEKLKNVSSSFHRDSVRKSWMSWISCRLCVFAERKERTGPCVQFCSHLKQLKRQWQGACNLRQDLLNNKSFGYRMSCTWGRQRFVTLVQLWRTNN